HPQAFANRLTLVVSAYPAINGPASDIHILYFGNFPTTSFHLVLPAKQVRVHKVTAHRVHLEYRLGNCPVHPVYADATALPAVSTHPLGKYLQSSNPHQHLNFLASLALK